MFDAPRTRHSLLLELGRRSDDAWAEFLEVYESAIYRACRARGLQDADARDVTQEVLAAVHARLVERTFDPDRGSFRGWLMGVVRNLSVDTLAGRAKRRVGSDGSLAERAMAELADPRASDESGFDLEYRRAVFAWAAQKVRAEVREVTWKAFQLTAVQGLAAGEVAARLGIPVGNVYTAKCRVVARIRARIDDFESKD